MTIINDRSEGAHQFAATGSIAVTAKRLGIAGRTVAAWRSGAKRPSATSRRRVEERLGVAVGAWDRIIPAAVALSAEPRTTDEPISTLTALTDMKQAIFSALEPWPDALGAVKRVLAAFERPLSV